MIEEMRKRLEEAADNFIGHPYEIEEGFEITGKRKAFKHGAEQGYKEAIAQAKEWLLENTISHYNPDTDARWVDTNECEDSKEFVYRFEADMNKLWEDEK